MVEIIPEHYIIETIKDYPKKQERMGISFSDLFRKLYTNKELQKECLIYNRYDLETLKDLTRNTLLLLSAKGTLNIVDGIVYLNHDDSPCSTCEHLIREYYAMVYFPTCNIFKDCYEARRHGCTKNEWE